MQVVFMTLLPINCSHQMDAYSVPFTDKKVFVSSSLLVFFEMLACVVVAPNLSYMLL